MNDELLLDLYLALLASVQDCTNGATLLARLAAEARVRQADDAQHETWRSEFDKCLHAIAESPDLLVCAIAAWLTEEADVPLACELLQKVDVNTLTQIQAANLDLSNLSPRCAIQVAYRLCGRWTQPAFALGWVLSMHRDFPNDTEIDSAVETLLLHLQSEYAEASRAFLTDPTSAFRELPRVRAALPGMLRQAAERDARPHLQEFAMTVEMRLMQASLRRGTQRDISRRAEEHSIVSQIAQRHRVKYAHRVVIGILEGAEVHETPVTLSEHRLEMELPLSEATDPLHGLLHRENLWQGPAE